MKKSELVKIWKQLDNACEALEKLSHDLDGLALLHLHENRIDVSAINGLKNDIETLIDNKSRKQTDLK